MQHGARHPRLQSDMLAAEGVYEEMYYKYQ